MKTLLHPSLFACLLLSTPALAQGVFMGMPVVGPTAEQTPSTPAVPPAAAGRPAITIKSLTIKATIVDGVATTELEEVIHSNRRFLQEATWLLPLPPDATADRFEMTVNGKRMTSEVLDATTARAIYEDIVRKQKDPALLEYLDNGCLRARVFPIPAFGDVLLKVRYRQVLPQTAGLCRWSFPLRAAKCAGQMADKVVLDLRIKTKPALKNVYSSLPEVDVVRRGDHEARASMELTGGKVPERDLAVFYGVSDQALGLHVLTYRKPLEPGYFLMMLAPKQAWDDEKRVRKCITFVLDTSGSMLGRKIEQARAALRFFLGSLQDGDYFNVIPFATQAEY